MATTNGSGRPLVGYELRDWEVVDYHSFPLDGTDFWFRGPRPAHLDAGEYIVCLGAAQTYGCFCAQPFPALLQQRLGRPVLNLGYGGAGPLFFLRRPELIEYVNRSRLAIVQVMSARSEDNRLFESGGLEQLVRRSDGSSVSAAAAYASVLNGMFGRWRTRLLVAETRRNWIAHTQQLLDSIRVPRVLLWLSRRPPAYRERYSDVQALFGDFPQLVNEKMIAAVRHHADAYVECVTSRGSPQPLVSRFTGQPTTIDPSQAGGVGRTSRPHAFNFYYPSPEMHEDAAAALEPTCDLLLPSNHWTARFDPEAGR
ncbi:MAG: hypothetical protein QOD06_2400 [Candidatus Binatota bacterium]|nr:hypothetical protein [Candidatus Binatota bacterium]